MASRTAALLVRGPLMGVRIPTASILSNGLVCARRFQATEATGVEAKKKDTHGVSHWNVTRISSVAQWGLIPYAFVQPGPIADLALGVVIPIHAGYGFDMIITDYVHGKTTVKAMQAANVAFTVAALGGFLFFNLHDIGITAAVKALWSL